MGGEAVLSIVIFKVWSPSSGDLLEMQIIRPHPRPTESERLQSVF